MRSLQKKKWDRNYAKHGLGKILMKKACHWPQVKTALSFVPLAVLLLRLLAKHHLISSPCLIFQWLAVSRSLSAILLSDWIFWETIYEIILILLTFLFTAIIHYVLVLTYFDGYMELWVGFESLTFGHSIIGKRPC